MWLLRTSDPLTDEKKRDKRKNRREKWKRRSCNKEGAMNHHPVLVPLYTQSCVVSYYAMGSSCSTDANLTNN